MRSAGTVLGESDEDCAEAGWAVCACNSVAPAAKVHALPTPVLMKSLRETVMFFPQE
jgi:hypothetical protein